MLISSAALRQAQTNYNKKFKEDVAKATKDASADLAQFMCQKVAAGGGGTGGGNVDTDLLQAWAISYDISAGMTLEQLMSGGGRNIISTAGGGASAGDSKQNKLADVIDALAVFGGKPQSVSAGGGITQLTTAIFSRETRNCHICTTTTVKSCSASGGTKGFLGIGAKGATSSCTMSAPSEKCEDILM